MANEAPSKKRKITEGSEEEELFYPVADEHGIFEAASQNKAIVTKPAPNFEGAPVLLPGGKLGETSLAELQKERYLVIFFYPLDWTFVCPTEICSFSDRIAEFEKLNCGIVGASVDSVYSHLAWTKAPRSKGGLGGEIQFPLIGDITKQIAQDYGVLMDTGFTLRGLFIIDGKGIIRHITMNDPPVGRNVDEVLRLVQAYQFSDEKGEVCPCNWKPGNDTITPDPEKSLEYFAKKGD